MVAHLIVDMSVFIVICALKVHFLNFDGFWRNFAFGLDVVKWFKGLATYARFCELLSAVLNYY